MEQEGLFYENRFLESWAGAIITNPSTAIVELVANCWDAYATEVKITWPDFKAEGHFIISDNGVGMTRDEFDYIWRAMSYDRVARYGPTSMVKAVLPASVFVANTISPQRKTDSSSPTRSSANRISLWFLKRLNSLGRGLLDTAR